MTVDIILRQRSAEIGFLMLRRFCGSFRRSPFVGRGHHLRVRARGGEGGRGGERGLNPFLRRLLVLYCTTIANHPRQRRENRAALWETALSRSVLPRRHQLTVEKVVPLTAKARVFVRHRQHVGDPCSGRRHAHGDGAPATRGLQLQARSGLGPMLRIHAMLLPQERAGLLRELRVRRPSR